MKRLLFTLAAIMLTLSAVAQKKTYPETPEMTPEMTEFWFPQPKVITPGDFSTNSAPSDAIILFDGKDLSKWKSCDGGKAKWDVHDGVFTVVRNTGGIETKEKFGSFQLHIEWSAPTVIDGESQGRGNSGVFLQGRYEVQILDNYQNETYTNGQAGSIYKQKAPLVNAMRKPGEWNTYDIIYNAPVFNEDGSYRVPPTVTVLHNGVLVINNYSIRGITEYVGHPVVEPHGDGPIMLQDHGNPVNFRNIWIRRL